MFAAGELRRRKYCGGMAKAIRRAADTAVAENNYIAIPSALMGNLDLIQARSSGDERLQRLAANAMEAARRGAKLSGQLLRFSRTQRLQLAAVDLEKRHGVAQAVRHGAAGAGRGRSAGAPPHAG